MYGTYQRLCVSVHASNLAVIRAFRKKLTKECKRDMTKEMRATRKRYYNVMLDYHRKEQRTYSYFFKG